MHLPKDRAVLGLEDSAGASPAVQEPAAQLAGPMPVEQAAKMLEHWPETKRCGVWTPPGAMNSGHSSSRTAFPIKCPKN